MEYGRKYRIGNFVLQKYNMVLGRKDLSELRSNLGVPVEVRRQLGRGKLPCIRVEAGSGMWSVTFTCVMSVYHMLDSMVADDASAGTLHHLLTMWFTDCTVVGDAEYQEDKARAMRAFMERQKAADVDKEEDDGILDELRKDEEARAAVVDMAKEVDRIEKEEGDGNGDKEGR